MALEPAFWRRKTLDELDHEEWEALCDGCAKCCLNKLEDEDTGEVFYTPVACRLLDTDSCRCNDYANRSDRVPDCIALTPARTHEFHWLPATCAYRLMAEGRPLPAWHPLESGDPDSVHAAGISVREFASNETGEETLDELATCFVEWMD